MWTALKWLEIEKYKHPLPAANKWQILERQTLQLVFLSFRPSAHPFYTRQKSKIFSKKSPGLHDFNCLCHCRQTKDPIFKVLKRFARAVHMCLIFVDASVLENLVGQSSLRGGAQEWQETEIHSHCIHPSRHTGRSWWGLRKRAWWFIKKTTRMWLGTEVKHCEAV